MSKSKNKIGMYGWLAIAGVIMAGLTAYHGMDWRWPVALIFGSGVMLLQRFKVKPALIVVDVVSSFALAALAVMRFGDGQYVQAGLLALLVLLAIVSAYAQGFRVIRKVAMGENIPGFYGIAWVTYNAPVAYCAPVPLNLVIGLARGVWFWLRHGWRDMAVTTHAAYAQGLQKGREQVAQSWGDEPASAVRRQAATAQR